MRITRYVWINNLPHDATEEDIKDSMQSFGKIQSIKLLEDCRNNPQAIIAFLDAKSATKAVESKIILNDVDLNLQYCESSGVIGPLSNLDKEKETMSKCSESELAYNAISISNLPQRSSDTNIREGLFHEYKKFGKIMAVAVNGQGDDRSALVTFKKRDDAEKAFEASQSKIFFGSKIKVVKTIGADPDLCPPEHALDEYHPKATKTLFVGNLNSNTITKEDLMKSFDKYGQIIDVDIKIQTNQMGSSYAFVQYTDIKSVVLALQDQEIARINGKPVKLGFGKSQPTQIVWLDNLSAEVSEHFLERHFSKYGRLSYVILDEKLSRALICFENSDSAQKCVNDIRGRTLLNKRIQVDFASNFCQLCFISKCAENAPSSTGKSLSNLEKLHQSVLSDCFQSGILLDQKRRYMDISSIDKSNTYGIRGIISSSPTRQRNVTREISPISSVGDSLPSETSMDYRSQRAHAHYVERHHRKHNSHSRNYPEEDLDYTSISKKVVSRKDYDYSNRRGLSPGYSHHIKRRILMNGNIHHSQKLRHNSPGEIDELSNEHLARTSHRSRGLPFTSHRESGSISPRGSLSLEARLNRRNRRISPQNPDFEDSDYEFHQISSSRPRHTSLTSSRHQNRASYDDSYDNFRDSEAPYDSPTLHGISSRFNVIEDNSRSPSPHHHRQVRSQIRERQHKDYISRERRVHQDYSSLNSVRYEINRRSPSRDIYPNYDREILSRSRPQRPHASLERPLSRHRDELELSPGCNHNTCAMDLPPNSVNSNKPSLDHNLCKLQRERENLLRELQMLDSKNVKSNEESNDSRRDQDIQPAPPAYRSQQSPNGISENILPEDSLNRGLRQLHQSIQQRKPANGHHNESAQLATIDSRIEAFMCQHNNNVSHVPKETHTPLYASEIDRMSFLSPTSRANNSFALSVSAVVDDSVSAQSPNPSFDRIISPCAQVHEITPTSGGKLSCSTPLAKDSRPSTGPMSPSSLLASNVFTTTSNVSQNPQVESVGFIRSNRTVFSFGEDTPLSRTVVSTYSSVLPGAGNIFSPMLNSRALDNSGEPEAFDPMDERIRQLDAEINRGKTRPPIDYSKFRIRRKNEAAAALSFTPTITSPASSLNPLTVAVSQPIISPQLSSRSPPLSNLRKNSHDSTVKNEDSCDFIKSMLSTGSKQIDLPLIERTGVHSETSSNDFSHLSESRFSSSFTPKHNVPNFDSLNDSKSDLSERRLSNDGSFSLKHSPVKSILKKDSSGQKPNISEIVKVDDAILPPNPSQQLTDDKSINFESSIVKRSHSNSDFMPSIKPAKQPRTDISRPALDDTVFSSTMKMKREEKKKKKEEIVDKIKRSDDLLISPQSASSRRESTSSSVSKSGVVENEPKKSTKLVPAIKQQQSYESQKSSSKTHSLKRSNKSESLKEHSKKKRQFSKRTMDYSDESDWDSQLKDDQMSLSEDVGPLYESMYDKIKRRTNKDQAQINEAVEIAKKLTSKKKRKSDKKLSRVIMNDHSSSNSSSSPSSSESSSDSDTDKCLSDEPKSVKHKSGKKKQYQSGKTKLSASDHQKLLRQLSVSPTSDSKSSSSAYSPPPMMHAQSKIGSNKLKTRKKSSETSFASVRPAKHQTKSVTKKKIDSGKGALMKKTKKCMALSSSSTKRLVEDHKKSCKRSLKQETKLKPVSGKKAKLDKISKSLKSPLRMRYPSCSTSEDESDKQFSKNGPRKSRIDYSKFKSQQDFDSNSDSSHPRISRSCSPESDANPSAHTLLSPVNATENDYRLKQDRSASTSSGHSRQLASPTPESNIISSDNVEIGLAPFEPDHPSPNKELMCEHEVTVVATSEVSHTNQQAKIPDIELISHTQLPINKTTILSSIPSHPTAFQIPISIPSSLSQNITLSNTTQPTTVLTALPTSFVSHQQASPQPLLLTTTPGRLPIIQGLVPASTSQAKALKDSLPIGGAAQPQRIALLMTTATGQQGAPNNIVKAGPNTFVISSNQLVSASAATGTAILQPTGTLKATQLKTTDISGAAISLANNATGAPVLAHTPSGQTILISSGPPRATNEQQNTGASFLFTTPAGSQQTQLVQGQLKSLQAQTSQIPKSQILQIATNPTTPVSAIAVNSPVPVTPVSLSPLPVTMSMTGPTSVEKYVSDVIARVTSEKNGETVSSPTPVPPSNASTSKNDRTKKPTSASRKPIVPIAPAGPHGLKSIDENSKFTTEETMNEVAEANQGTLQVSQQRGQTPRTFSGNQLVGVIPSNASTVTNNLHTLSDVALGKQNELNLQQAKQALTIHPSVPLNIAAIPNETNNVDNKTLGLNELLYNMLSMTGSNTQQPRPCSLPPVSAPGINAITDPGLNLPSSQVLRSTPVLISSPPSAVCSITPSQIGVPSRATTPASIANQCMNINEVLVGADHPCIWRGRLSLKNEEVITHMYHLSGHLDLFRSCMDVLSASDARSTTSSPSADVFGFGPGCQLLKISQRMRIDPSQLEGVQRKLRQSTDYTMCLALATTNFPQESDELQLQRHVQMNRILTDSFIRYLQEKSAAGIIHVCNSTNEAEHENFIGPALDRCIYPQHTTLL